MNVFDERVPPWAWNHVYPCPMSGCWLFVYRINRQGYGRLLTRKGSTRTDWLAHRWFYTKLVGEIPSELTIDHKCRNTLCVNPDHLEAVTVGVNVLRGTAPTAQNARKTHCKAGHLLDEQNTRPITNWNGKAGRRCRACDRIGFDARNAKRRVSIDRRFKVNRSPNYRR